LWCLHIPVHDRTPFTGLVKLVEDTVIEETKRRPQSPIYLVGDSLGAVLALAVAARNPELDLVLILSNPATSFDRSQLQLLFPFLQNTLPSTLSTVAPLLLSFTLGDPLKFAQGRVNDNASILQKAEQLCTSLFPLFPLLPKLLEILPPEMLGWKLSMLHTAALYTNSRIHAVRAEVLVLARLVAL
jgi:pimeloyl-ACP methyl ester carboxylesterase